MDGDSRGQAGEGEAEAEKRFADFLRLRLARLRRSPALVAARDDGGGLFLYFRRRPESEREWLDEVSGLLNEAEALRRLVSSGQEGEKPLSGGSSSLFQGMSGMLLRP